MLRLTFPPRLSTAVPSWKTDLFAYIKQFRAQAIMNGFTDAEWDAYVERLDQLQYQEWLQWYQDMYDGHLGVIPLFAITYSIM